MDDCCKVGRVVSEHGLAPPREFDGSVSDFLVARWRGEGSADAAGYRRLAEWINKRILRSAYERAGRGATSAQLDAEYAALAGPEGPDRAEVMADLEADGLDAESVVGDFVGKSTVARHLKQCLDAEKPSESGDPRWEIDKIEFARERFHDQVGPALSSLARRGRVAGADTAEVDTPVRLSCPDCPTRVRLETALDRGYVCADHSGPGDGTDSPDVADVLAEFSQ